MNNFFATSKNLLNRLNLRSHLPNSVDCLRFDANLYKQLYSARHFDDPNKTLEFSLGQSNPGGVGLEFGVYSGRTLKVIAKKYPGKTFGFDSFQGLPEFWRDGFPTGTFKVNEIPKIDNALVIEGLFQDSLEPFVSSLSEEISFIHLDADLYSSTKFVLIKLNDFIKPGCIIVFDEFMNYPGFEEHEYLAFTEWGREFRRECLPIAFTDWHEQMSFRVIR